jgi:extradiol dioxygenase family protein
MRKPQRVAGAFLLVISIVDDWVKLIRQMMKQNISFVMCRLCGFEGFGGLDKKPWLPI